MSETIVIDEYYNLWLLLTQATSVIYKVRHKKVGKYLPTNQIAALGIILVAEGQITPFLLSRRLFLEPQTVSEIITRMQLKGLVTKEKDKQQRNVVRIKITEKGREVCETSMGQDLIHHFISALSEEQRKQLRESLTILYRQGLNELDIKEEESPIPLK